MQCKICGNSEFRLAHRTTLQRWLSLVLPLWPYECTYCEHRHLRRITPFFNAIRLLSASVFGLTLMLISIALMVSLYDREPKVTDGTPPALAKPPGTPVPVEQSRPEWSAEMRVQLALESPHPGEPSMIGNEFSLNTWKDSEEAVAHNIGLERSLAVNDELEIIQSSSVRVQEENNQLSQSQAPAQSAPLTMDANKREELPQSVPPVTNHQGTFSERLDTLQISRSKDILKVKLQGTGAFEKFKVFELDQGERLVVDIAGQ